MNKTHSGELFFIKDSIEDGKKALEHFPMRKMLGDHFIKPLQGSMFSKYQAYIKGCLVIQGTCICDGENPVNHSSPSANNFLM